MWPNIVPVQGWPQGFTIPAQASSLLPESTGRRIRDGAVELSIRYDRFRIGERDLLENGVEAFSGGINWMFLKHLRAYAAVTWQELRGPAPELGRGTSWTVTGGFAAYFLRKLGWGY